MQKKQLTIYEIQQKQNKPLLQHIVHETWLDPQEHRLLLTYLAHLAFAVSSEEWHVIDLIHHHKVLFFPLEVLQYKE